MKFNFSIFGIPIINADNGDDDDPKDADEPIKRYDRNKKCGSCGRYNVSHRIASVCPRCYKKEMEKH